MIREMDDEFETLEKYIEESRAKFDGRRRLRETNSRDNIEYPSEISLNKLDSSIKKNSAFVKRLKVFTESQKDQILNEFDRLNLTKFTSEAASSIIEAKLKLNDVPAVIEVCTKFNRTYREFSRHLLEQYIKYFPIIKRKNYDSNAPVQSGSSNLVALSHAASSLHIGSGGGGGGGSSGSLQASNLVSKIQNTSTTNNNKNPNETALVTLNPSKIRVDLRLFAELIICGVFPLRDSFPVLMNLLCYLMVFEKSSHQNANAILTFCKGCGDELLGLVPRNIRHLADQLNIKLPTSDLISLKRQEMLKTYVRDHYFTNLKYLQGLHDDLNELVNRNKRVYKSKGEISKESKELVEIRQAECQKVQSILIQLAELLGETMPEFFDLDSMKEQTVCEIATEVSESSKLDLEPGSSRVPGSLWDDEGSRSFYEDLLDLKVYFPNLIVKVIPSEQKKIVSAAVSTSASSSNTTKDKSLEDLVGEQLLASQSLEKDSKTTAPVESCESRDSTPTMKDCAEDDKDVEETISSSSSEESLNAALETSSSSLTTPATTSKSSSQQPLTMSQAVANRVQPEQYFAKLSNCVNRDMIDNASIDFIKFFNTKFGRRKLIKTLFNVQRTRLDLLPFFARLTATIYKYVPSVGNELVSLLRQDFRNLFKKKDQINIESKVKNVRFIGELVKFNLYSKQEALNCLKMLLSDFTHHHIEMTCNLLETCGSLLYKSETHHQLRLLLEQMMRKKLLLSVDSKYVTMIENAYYFTNPPEIVRQVIEEPPVHTYVRYLLYECLNRSTIEKVLQKLKKLNWNNKPLTKFVINCMTEAYNLKFYNIRYLAALLATLNKESQWISIAVIDGVVEDILLMMEINELHYNQRRIPMIRYFGELYNYRLSDSSLVFKILYSLITYGVYYPEPGQTLTQIPMSHLDPPDNLFRIKLVCDLLETCGQYLSLSGQEKKKLDCYLLFFQRYYWCKKHIYLLHPYCLAKTSNQFPASIEYLYNDTIFNLRPTFQMATSYTQANQTVQNFIDNLIVNQPST